jgi:nicotinamidase/pyrazinamidase
MKALIIVDVQLDFLPGGALAVPDGDAVIPVINNIQNKFDLVVATQDWHPAGHKSFASVHRGRQVFDKIDLNGLEQVLWPDHCVQGTPGAEYHSSLNMNRVEAIFRKGMDTEIDSYSGFFDNGHLKATGMGDYLKGRGIKEIFVCGLAADFCVYFTALDGMVLEFKSTILEDATRAIDQDGFDAAKENLLAKGGAILHTSSL